MNRAPRYTEFFRGRLGTPRAGATTVAWTSTRACPRRRATSRCSVSASVTSS